MPPKRAPTTRGVGKDAGNLRAMLSGLQTDPNNPKYLRLKEATTSVLDKVTKSYTYNYASTSTQNRRLLHLNEYTSCVKAAVKLNETNGEEHEDWEERLWGKDYIEDNLRTYVLLISEWIQPRSFDSKSIKFSTLAARRQSMVYWVIQKCDQKVVSIKDVYNSSNKALYMAFREHNMTTVAPPKLYITKDDMKHLIEYVMYSHANVDNAQQMVIVWLDSFICGVRPGTIGASKHRLDQYLRWEDIELSRTADGNYQVVITHKWLKGYRDEKLKPLRFHVSGPQYAEDVMYSLPHRLLALALRRKILLHFDTADDLHNSNRTKITIKPAALQDPVILAASPKGLTLIWGKAALASGLSAGFQRVCIDAGLQSGLTIYACRRSAGTRAGNVLGNEKARGILGHDMTGHTFESSYEQGTVSIDVMNMAMGRQLQAAGELLGDDSLSINRIKQSVNNKATWTKNWVKQHKEYLRHSELLHKAELAIHEADGEERLAEARLYFNKTERTLYRQAAIAFQRLELQIVKENMTVEELQKRRQDAKALGKLEQQLKDAADAAREEAENQVEDVQLDAEADDLVDVRDGARAEPMAEGDNEDEVAENIAAPIKVSGITSNRESDSQPGDKDAKEMKAIIASGKWLIDTLVDQESEDKSAEFHCKSCEADPTVPDELPANLPAKSRNTQYKNKLYKRGDLERHVASDYHSPKMVWYRKMGDFNEARKCPYDPDWTDCQFTGKPKEILGHVLRNTGQSEAHLRKAAEDGIFFRDFDAAANRSLGKVQAKGRRGEGSIQKEYGDPEEFEVEAFVPPGNITTAGEVEEDESVTPYAKVVRLPPKADLVGSTLYHEHAEGIHGRVADVLQSQRGFLARRADAILRQHGTEQTDKGETKQKATSGKGKRRVEAIAKLRERLTEMRFDWGGNLSDGSDDDDADPDEEAAGDAEE